MFLLQVQVRPLESTTVECQHDWHSGRTLHRLATVLDYFQNLVGRVGGQVHVLVHLYSVDVAVDDAPVQVFVALRLAQARDGSDFLEETIDVVPVEQLGAVHGGQETDGDELAIQLDSLGSQGDRVVGLQTGLYF